MLRSQSCVIGTLILNSQDKIDNFPVDYPNCTTLLGNLTLFGDNISNSDSLYQITEIIGDLSVLRTRNLIDLQGLDQLQTIEGTLQILDNTSIISLEGLNNLQFVNNLTLHSNIVLTDVDAFENLTKIDSTLIIVSNDSLENLHGFSQLSSLNSGLGISNNNMLQNFEGLHNLEFVSENLQLNGNDQITNMSGFNKISYSGNLIVDNIKSLESLEGFDSLDSVGRNVSIFENPKLKTLDGLESLRKSGGFLAIARNDLLEDLTALENLTEIKEALALSENPSLENLIGLKNCVLKNNIGQLYLENNPLLRFCDIEPICEYLDANGFASIFGNAMDCSSDSTIIQACSVTSSVEVANTNTTGVLIFPNPSNGSFSVQNIEGFEALKIFDQLGRLVRELSVKNQSRIDVNDLDKGYYQIHLTNVRKLHSKMIMVH